MSKTKELIKIVAGGQPKGEHWLKYIKRIKAMAKELLDSPEKPELKYKAKPKPALVHYNNHPIAVDGTFVHFDGQYERETDTLTIFRIHGDVRLFDEAAQNIAIDNNFGKVVGNW